MLQISNAVDLRAINELLEAMELSIRVTDKSALTFKKDPNGYVHVMGHLGNPHNKPLTEFFRSIYPVNGRMLIIRIENNSLTKKYDPFKGDLECVYVDKEFFSNEDLLFDDINR